jgi:phage-related protein
MAKSNTIAAIILGASAGVALLRFFNMPKEEKEQFYSHIKKTANELLDDAEETVEKVEQYMNEIKLKGDDELVDKLMVVKRMLKELFGTEKRYLL